MRPASGAQLHGSETEPEAVGGTAGAATEPIPTGERDPLLAVILVLALGLCAYHLDWGLPDGGQSAWAADSYGPLKVLGIAYRSFQKWNSGWFYFKHPLGYPLLQVLAYAPYLAFLRVTGGWRHPLAQYPYGFSDPERALLTLAMLGRALNVAFTLGSVALTYAIATRLAGRRAGRLAAWFVATAYPFVFYAHTTNVDPAYLFWLSLALYAAIRAADTRSLAPWGWLGLAAAMAVATKEQGFGFVLPLPLLALGFRVRKEGSLRPCWDKPVWWMAAAALVTTVLANNVLYNPRGFIGRVAFMLGRPLQPMERALLPVEFRWYKGAQEWTYLQQVWDGIDSAFGLLLTLLAVIGAVAAWRRPRTAVWLWIPVLCLYYLGLRGLVIAPNEPTLVVTLRYLMPIMVAGAVAAAMLLAQLSSASQAMVVRSLARGAATLLVVLGLARAVELDLLLSRDPRYQAEDWMGKNVPPAAAIEVYQDREHLPRFRDTWTVQHVSIEQRSIAALQQRHPDFIVLSSASRGSIAHVRTEDWHETRTWVRPVEAAVQLQRALTAGELPYRRVVEFEEHPFLFRSKITSLSPTITIYARTLDRTSSAAECAASDQDAIAVSVRPRQHAGDVGAGRIG